MVILAILIGAGIYFKWNSLHQAEVIGQKVKPTAVHNIDQLTAQENVVNYLRQYHRLPDFISRKEKRNKMVGAQEKVIYVRLCRVKRLVAIDIIIEKNCYSLRQIGNGMKLISIITVVIEGVIGCFTHQMD